MPTVIQDNAFASEMQSYVIVTKEALDAAIGWIKKNLSPDDVFDDKDLSLWAENNGYIKEEK